MNKFWNVKTADGQASLDLFGYVGGSKDDPWGKGFNESEFLEDFRKIPSESALNISINSFGGAVYTGLSIYSLLKAHKGPITFRVDGAAMSAATIITSVPNAKVVMPKGSMMMIHKVSSVAVGTSDDMRKMADDMEKLEENVVGIYAEKTGRTAEEIREKLNAESYFTAEEAVAFGLADEVDETTEVRNVCSGGFVMLNGLKAEAKLFEHAPKGFIKAEEPQASATKKEVQRMNLEQLKAEYPDLVQAIREEAAAEAMADARKEAFAEGVKAERERIRAIEDITSSDDYKDLADQAKFETGITAEALAVLILKADKTRREKMLKEREEDARDLDGTANEGNVGIVNNKESAELSLQKRLTEACKYRRG